MKYIFRLSGKAKHVFKMLELIATTRGITLVDTRAFEIEAGERRN